LLQTIKTVNELHRNITYIPTKHKSRFRYIRISLGVTPLPMQTMEHNTYQRPFNLCYFFMCLHKT